MAFGGDLFEEGVAGGAGVVVEVVGEVEGVGLLGGSVGEGLVLEGLGAAEEFMAPVLEARQVAGP